MLLAAIAETFWPAIPFPDRRTRWQHVFLNLKVNILISGISVVFSAPTIELAQWSFGGKYTFIAMLKSLNWASGTIGLLVLTILYDFLNYWIHRVQHIFPILWRIHRIHHADRYLDFSSALRFHPIEFVFRFIIQSTVIAVVGLPPAVITTYQIWVIVALIFSHANFTVPGRLAQMLGTILVLPNYHRIHHSEKRLEHDSNYSIGCMIWDHLLQTFTAPDQSEKFTMGLPEYSKPESLGSILGDPFVTTVLDQ